MNPAPDWMDQARGLLEVLKSGLAAPAAGDAHAADCTWCPLCQAAAVVRGERPEVTAALADVLTATAAALRTFAERPAPADAADEAGQEDVVPQDSGPQDSGPQDHGPQDHGPGDPPPALQRIDIA